MPTARSYYPTMLDYAETTDPEHDGFIRSVIDNPESTATHAAFSDWLAERGRHVESLRHHIWAIDPKFDVLVHEGADRVWVPEFKGIKNPLPRLRKGIARAVCPLVVDGTPKTLAAMHDWPWPYGATLELANVKRINTNPRSQELRYIEAIPGLWRDEHLAVVETHTPLQVANIFPGDVRQANIDRLSALPELESLSIQGSSLGDAVFGGKGRFPALRHLNIDLGEGITLGKLSEIASLESLTLTQVELDRRAGEELQNLPNLRRLALDDVSGVDFLRVLPRLTRLESLDVTNCALAPMMFTRLGSLSELTRLQVWALPFSDKDLRAICEFPRLTSLWLGNANCSTAATAQLGRLRSLRELALDTRTLTGNGFGFLKELSQLVHLRLEARDTPLGKALAGVGAMRNLRILDIRGGSVSEAELAPFAKLEKLHTLQFSSCNLNDAGLARLGGMDGLMSLELYETDVTPKGFGVVRGLRRLRHLMYRRHDARLRKDTVARLAKHLPFAEIDA